MNRMLFPLLAAATLTAATAHAADRPHNLILFVPDGLRAVSVTPEASPTFAAVRDQGTNFQNSHSIFPTFTMANASALSTGHLLGDTGVFSNAISSGFAVTAAAGSVTPNLENDAVLGEMDSKLNGNFVDETAIVAAARQAGFGTALIGKLGPTLMFDHQDRTGGPTIVIDDATGTAAGIPLSPEMTDAMKAAQLPLSTPTRGVNSDAGDMKTPGTTFANVIQQNYFADVATKAVLPMLKAKGQPFVLVFWSRDPDGTQHNQGDSLMKVAPGINGPSSKLAIKNADDDLAKLRATLDTLGLAADTDIVVSADHGFSTISKESQTSPAARASYADTPTGFLPLGFLAIDLANALHQPLYDPSDKNAQILAEHHPKSGSALIGADPAHPDVIVAANGGSDLIYLPKADKSLAQRTVAALLKQDYVSGIFVDDRLGRIAGTLPLSAIGLHGAAVTPSPAIVVNFRSYAAGCDQPIACSVEIADAPLQQGQGYHGNFNRGDTRNFMAAMGPDFKTGFVDPAPVSNADIGRTIAHVLKLDIKAKGKLEGRVIGEAMPGGTVPKYTAGTLKSQPANGLATTLLYQDVQKTRYFDAAGFPGRTVGVDATKATASR